MGTKRLVLLGGGHAHLLTLANIQRIQAQGHAVTVIQPSEYHYYSGMGPGMLGGRYSPEELRFSTRQQVESQGGRFITDRASLIDPNRQLVILESSGQEISYDVLSCNVGSSVAERGHIADGQTVFFAKPIEELFRARQEILALGKRQSLQLAVIGGGPAAVEIAGNLWQLGQEPSLHSLTIRLFAGKTLLPRIPETIRNRIRQLFFSRGMTIVEGAYMREVAKGRVVLANSMAYQADIVFLATGVVPSNLFRQSGLAVGVDGGLLVNAALQSCQYANIFAGGDCLSFAPQPLDKVGVYAVRQNPVLYHNLMAALAGGPLASFAPGGRYLLIYNLGGGIGLFRKGRLVFAGKPALWLKEYIDKRFIAKFQGQGTASA